MPDVTLQMTEQTYRVVAQYTGNGTPEEVQTILQKWFSKIEDIGWGFELDLQMQIEAILEAEEDD